jgi:hypothetical protein
MRRREFMTLVSAVTATWPLAAPPQGSFSRTSRMHALWLALVCVAFGATWSAPIHAHDIYSNVLDKNGKPCCDQIDCRPAHFQVTPQE